MQILSYLMSDIKFTVRCHKNETALLLPSLTAQLFCLSDTSFIYLYKCLYMVRHGFWLFMMLSSNLGHVESKDPPALRSTSTVMVVGGGMVEMRAVKKAVIRSILLPLV